MAALNPLPDPIADNGSDTGILTCGGPEGLAAIQLAGMELVIWRRELPLKIRDWLEGLDPSILPDFRILVSPRDLIDAVEPELEACGLPPGELRNLFVRDVEELVRLFSQLTRADLVDVRLERITTDACWKFHRDRVENRLLTTYRGSATQWVRPCHAERALKEQRDYQGPLEHLNCHDVALFKGSSAEGSNGIVHRSPPIAGTCETRLLLCLNKPSAASPEPWQPQAEPSEQDDFGS